MAISSAASQASALGVHVHRHSHRHRHADEKRELDQTLPLKLCHGDAHRVKCTASIARGSDTLISALLCSSSAGLSTTTVSEAQGRGLRSRLKSGHCLSSSTQTGCLRRRSTQGCCLSNYGDVTINGRREYSISSLWEKRIKKGKRFHAHAKTISSVYGAFLSIAKLDWVPLSSTSSNSDSLKLLTSALKKLPLASSSPSPLSSPLRCAVGGSERASARCWTRGESNRGRGGGAYSWIHPSITSRHVSQLASSHVSQLASRHVSRRKALCAATGQGDEVLQYSDEFLRDDEDGDGGGARGFSPPSPPEEDLRDDDVLPESLEGAILQSSRAVADVIATGAPRTMVEFLIPDLENLAEEGAQLRLWDLSRLFVEALQIHLGVTRVRAVFPDAGSAAMLGYRWKDSAFQISCLSDRQPILDDDEVIVLVAPDYQLLESVIRIADGLINKDDDGVISDDNGTGSLQRPLVLWNPRLTSGDIGVGLNSRRMRDEFLRTFVVAYSMRPLPMGCVIRCYPRPWQVFIDDSDSPGRYNLVKEQATKPDPDDLDSILMRAMQRGGGGGGGVGGGEEKKEEVPSMGVQVMAMFASIQRFMRALSQ